MRCTQENDLNPSTTMLLSFFIHFRAQRRGEKACSRAQYDDDDERELEFVFPRCEARFDDDDNDNFLRIFARFFYIISFSSTSLVLFTFFFYLNSLWAISSLISRKSLEKINFLIQLHQFRDFYAS